MDEEGEEDDWLLGFDTFLGVVGAVIEGEREGKKSKEQRKGETRLSSRCNQRERNRERERVKRMQKEGEDDVWLLGFDTVLGGSWG